MTEKQYNFISSLYTGVMCLDKYIIKFHQEETKKKFLSLTLEPTQLLIKCGKLYRKWTKANTLIAIAEINDPYDSPERDDAIEYEREIMKQLRKEEKTLLKVLKAWNIIE